MPALKALYESIGFTNVITYIQSGNVLFNAKGNPTTETIINKIETAISKQFGFAVPVLIRTTKELESIQKNNPYLTQKDVDITKLHVTFLAKKPDTIALEKLATINYAPDTFILEGKELFLYCPSGYGNTKLNNNFFENKLKMTATTRNWKTVGALAALAMQ